MRTPFLFLSEPVYSVFHLSLISFPLLKELGLLYPDTGGKRGRGGEGWLVCGILASSLAGPVPGF